jgi:hypothetical protein
VFSTQDTKVDGTFLLEDGPEPLCVRLSRLHFNVTKDKPPPITKAIDGWISSNHLPPSIRFIHNRVPSDDIDAFIFLKALKSRAKHPVLFERAFCELFGTPGLAEKIANSDPRARYEYASHGLVLHVPDEPCPLDPSWSDGSLWTFTRWLVNKCRLGPANIKSKLEPLIAHLKSGIHWNNSCFRKNMKPYSILIESELRLYEHPRDNPDAILFSLLEDKFRSCFKRPIREQTEATTSSVPATDQVNQSGSDLASRIGDLAAPLFDSYHRTSYSTCATHDGSFRDPCAAGSTQFLTRVFHNSTLLPSPLPIFDNFIIHVHSLYSTTLSSMSTPL